MGTIVLILLIIVVLVLSVKVAKGSSSSKTVKFLTGFLSFASEAADGGNIIDILKNTKKTIDCNSNLFEIHKFLNELKSITVLRCGTYEELNDPYSTSIYLNSRLGQCFGTIQTKDVNNVVIPFLSDMMYDLGMLNENSTVEDIYVILKPTIEEYKTKMKESKSDIIGMTSFIDFPYVLEATSDYIDYWPNNGINETGMTNPN